LRRVFFWQRYCRRIRTWRRCVGSCDHGESSITDGVGADSRRGAACFKPKPGGFKLASNFDVDRGAVFNRLDHRRCSRAQFVVALPKYLLQIVIAVFILASTWAPKFQSASTGRIKFFIVGVITTIVTMFVGGTGVLVGAFVAPACQGRHQFVSTHSVVMTIQHGLKIVSFAVLGFAFGPYVPLLVGLVLCSFIGSYAGKLALNRLPEPLFRIALKTTLTILSLQLLYTAVSQLIA